MCVANARLDVGTYPSHQTSVATATISKYRTQSYRQWQIIFAESVTLTSKEEFDRLFAKHGNVTAVAHACLVSRPTIYTWMKDIGYTPPKTKRRRTSKIRGVSSAKLIVIDDILPEKTEYQKFYEYMKQMADTNPDHPVYTTWMASADTSRRKRVLENTISEFIKFKGL